MQSSRSCTSTTRPMCITHRQPETRPRQRAVDLQHAKIITPEAVHTDALAAGFIFSGARRVYTSGSDLIDRVSNRRHVQPRDGGELPVAAGEDNTTGRADKQAWSSLVRLIEVCLSDLLRVTQNCMVWCMHVSPAGDRLFTFAALTHKLLTHYAFAIHA